MLQFDTAAQFSHALPTPQGHSNAGAVHKGNAAEIQHQFRRQRDFDLPFQLCQQTPGPMMIQFSF